MSLRQGLLGGDVRAGWEPPRKARRIQNAKRLCDKVEQVFNPPVEKKEKLKEIDVDNKEYIPVKDRGYKDTRKHLIPINERDPEEARLMRQKGGYASAEANRRKKTMKQCMEILLNMNVLDKETIKEMKRMGIDARELTYLMLISVGMVKSASRGNIRAAQEIRSLMGENTESQEGDVNILITRAKKGD